jgi:UDP-GlcNAc:undecaprenyl-phosphate GlcNAc-1-phosphate transferase
MVPVLVLGLPVFDTMLVIISRIRRRLNPATTPGKDHISHRLVAAGMTKREAVLTLYVVSFILGLLATFVTQASVLEGYFVGGLVVLAGFYALWRVERPPFFNHENAG